MILVTRCRLPTIRHRRGALQPQLTRIRDTWKNQRKPIAIGPYICRTSSTRTLPQPNHINTMSILVVGKLVPKDATKLPTCRIVAGSLQAARGEEERAMHDYPSPYEPVHHYIDVIPQTAVGRRLEEMRRERHLSQRALAGLATLHRETIGRLEAGVTKYPQWSTLECLADAFGMTVTQLQRELGMEGRGREIGYHPPPRHYSAVASRCAGMIEKMTPRQQGYIEGLCMQMVARAEAGPGELPKR